MVKNSFLDGSPWTIKTAEANQAGDNGWDEHRVSPPSWNYTDIIEGMQRNASGYEQLNISACFDLYNDYWAPQGNAIVLVKNETVQTPPDDSLLMYVSIIPRDDDWGKNMWALGNGTGNFTAKEPPLPVTKWYLGPPKYEVSRCLVQPPQTLKSRCRLQYSPPIMFTICMMNLIKASVMLCIWLLRRWEDRDKDKGKHVLYTLGDAIASFMCVKDVTTEDMCLATKYDFRTKRTWYMRRKTPAIVPLQPVSDDQNNPPQPSRNPKKHPPREFKEEPKRWRSAASLRRWIVFLCT